MKPEQRHRIAQKTVDTFRNKVQRTHADLFRYPLALDALTVMISETYPIAVHEIEDLDILKISRAVKSFGGELVTSTLDSYMALAGFLYAHRGGGVIFIERGDGEERRKFSLAHELGHFINDYYEPVYLKYEASNTLPLFTEDRTAETQQVIAARCSPVDIYGGGEPTARQNVEPPVKALVEQLHREQKARFAEIRANLFAAELLMPMDECARIESRCRAENRDIVRELRVEFGVSHQAATYRVAELQSGHVEEGFLLPSSTTEEGNLHQSAMRPSSTHHPR